MQRTSEHSGPAASGTLLVVARGVLLLAGALTLAGGVYFTFFASAEEGGVSTAGDWVVAGAAIGLALAYLLSALRLGRQPSSRAVLLTVVFVVAHIVFGLVKLIGYDEEESGPFLVADLIILTCLTLSRRER